MLNELFNLLRCPKSNLDLIYNEVAHQLETTDKKINYKINEKIPILFESLSNSDVRIISWWKDLYKQLYQNIDKNLNKKNINNYLDSFEDLMKVQNHLFYRNLINKINLKNKTLLEIGSGSGAHSASIKRLGAKVVACDITFERCFSTDKKLRLLNGENHMVINASAENIPLKNNSFDIVYSNGVLHHASDTQKCIDEVYRVLKINGRGIIMLYCRSSVEYFFNIIPKAIITGSIFRHKNEANWVGEVTEGKNKFFKIKNPITRVYNKSEILSLFKDFEVISLDKAYFSYKDFAIPKLTQIREKLLELFGKKKHPGGEIVYGKQIVPLTNLEKKLGKYLGFFWYITVLKK